MTWMGFCWLPRIRDSWLSIEKWFKDWNVMKKCCARFCFLKIAPFQRLSVSRAWNPGEDLVQEFGISLVSFLLFLLVGKFLSHQMIISFQTQNWISWCMSFYFFKGYMFTREKIVVSYIEMWPTWQPFVPRDPRSLETMQKLASITKEQPPDIKSDNSESVGPASNNSSVRLFKSCLAWCIFLGICTSAQNRMKLKIHGWLPHDCLYIANFSVSNGCTLWLFSSDCPRVSFNCMTDHINGGSPRDWLPSFLLV